MKEMMDWNTCLSGHIKKVSIDEEKILSIKKMCAVRLKVTRMINVDDETASVVAVDYYEVIKELLVALLLRYGMRSDNHECLISFFKNKFSNYEYEVSMMHSLKEVRNRVSYDGIFVKKEYIQNNKMEFEHMITLLGKLLDEN